MAPRRTIRVGPPVRGLTDFPEHSTPEHSTQALNVEFTGGGVATRRGTRRMVTDLYTQGGVARAATVKLVRSFADAGNNGFGLPMTAVGFVPTAGGDADEERLMILTADAGVVLDQAQLHAAQAQFTNDSPSSRWDSCLFFQASRRRPDLIVCTDHLDAAAATVRTFNRINGFGSVVGVNRTANPFHGTIVNPSPTADDPGDYTIVAGLPLRARFCRTHRSRLVLGHFAAQNWLGVAPPDLRATIWISNTGDANGWCLENIVQPQSGDATPITGLGEWQQHIVVFREASASLYWMTGPLPDSAVYRQVVTGRGCVAHGTILDDVLGMTIFLAADGLYGFNGTPEPKYLSAPIERSLRAALDAQPVSGAYAVHYPLRRQVWLVVPRSGPVPNWAYVMDYGVTPPAWSEFEFWTGVGAVGGGAMRLGGIGARNDGMRVYGVTHGLTGTLDYEQFDTGDAVDGQNGTEVGFLSRWESGPIGFGRADVNRWRYLRPTIRPQGNHAATLWWRRGGQRFDEASLNAQSTTASMDGEGGGNGLGAFVLGTDPLGAAEDHQLRVDVHSGGRGRSGRVGIQSVGAGAAPVVRRKFDVRGIEIDVFDEAVRR